MGDTAILSYDLDETETIFGQKLKADITKQTPGYDGTVNGRSSQNKCFDTTKTRCQERQT